MNEWKWHQFFISEHFFICCFGYGKPTIEISLLWSLVRLSCVCSFKIPVCESLIFWICTGGGCIVACLCVCVCILIVLNRTTKCALFGGHRPSFRLSNRCFMFMQDQEKKKWKTRHDKSNQPIHTRANDFWYVCTRTIFFSRALLYKKRKKKKIYIEYIEWKKKTRTTTWQTRNSAHTHKLTQSNVIIIILPKFRDICACLCVCVICCLSFLFLIFVCFLRCSHYTNIVLRKVRSVQCQVVQCLAGKHIL